MKFKFIQKYFYSKFEKNRKDKICDPLPIFPSVIKYDTNIKNLEDFNNLCDIYAVDYYQVKVTNTVKENRNKKDEHTTKWSGPLLNDFTTIIN